MYHQSYYKIRHLRVLPRLRACGCQNQTRLRRWGGVNIAWEKSPGFTSGEGTSARAFCAAVVTGVLPDGESGSTL